MIRTQEKRQRSKLPPVKKKKKLIAQVESQLLRRVRARGGLSRVELAREMKLSPSTVGIYVNRLIEEGFLRESEKAERDYGRPPMVLTLNPRGGQFVGVDFEARNIRAMAIDFSQEPVASVEKAIRQNDSVEQILQKIEAAIDEVRPADSMQLLGIGVGAPGLIDPARGLALSYSYIKGWENIPIAERLAQHFATPVHLENTVRAMAMAELLFGQGRDIDHFLCLGIRSGIGAGIVINRQLYRGGHNSSGEIGLWHCPLYAPPEATAAAREEDAMYTLQEIASVRAIVLSIRKAIENGAMTTLAGNREISIRDVVRAYRDGDALACQTIDAAAKALGWVATQLICAFNPQKIIFSGPLVALGDELLQPIRDTVQQLPYISRSSLPEIVNTELGEFEGALGAAALAVNEWRPAR